MKRVILHVDMNCFFASVELLYHPELRGLPVAVGGSEESRKGIVLAASYEAKKRGVKTAMTLRESYRLCPELVVLPPHYDRYIHFSKLAQKIYEDYTCLIEHFGIDEAWLDLTGCICLQKQTPMEIANEIRLRIYQELGITASVGVSDNKIFAKLASDYRKPNGCTQIDQSNYREVAWPLPVGDLLFIGKATQEKLNSHGIYTIGDLARSAPEYLHSLLGTTGELLHVYANGKDMTPVSSSTAEQAVKSVGNGMTVPRDMETYEDVHIVMMMLSENVSHRLRDHGMKAGVISVSMRSNTLELADRQMRIQTYTNLATEICDAAMKLVKANCQVNERGLLKKPLRSITVTVSGLVADGEAAMEQSSVFEPVEGRIRQERLERMIDSLRERFGHHCIKRALTVMDPTLGYIDARQELMVHSAREFSEVL